MKEWGHLNFLKNPMISVVIPAKQYSFGQYRILTSQSVFLM